MKPLKGVAGCHSNHFSKNFKIYFLFMRQSLTIDLHHIAEYYSPPVGAPPFGLSDHLTVTVSPGMREKLREAFQTLHTAAAPAVRAAVKTLAVLPNDTATAIFCPRTDLPTPGKGKSGDP